MPLLFRGIRTNRWAEAESKERYGWLEPDEIIADPLGDFATLEGKISLYLVKDDLSDLERVIAAVSATRGLANYGYALIDRVIVEDAKFRLEKSIGQTPDEEINNLHIDMVELSVQKLTKMTILFFNSSRRSAVYKPDVKKLWQKYADFLRNGKHLSDDAKEFFEGLGN